MQTLPDILAEIDAHNRAIGILTGRAKKMMEKENPVPANKYKEAADRAVANRRKNLIKNKTRQASTA